MGRWVFAVAGAFAFALATVHISACSLDMAGTADTVDATPDVITADVHIDTSVPDTGGGDVQLDTAPVDSGDSGNLPDARDAEAGIDCMALGQFFCGTQCVATCFGCAFGNTQCNATRVCGTDCASCGTDRFACYNCMGGPVVGVCLPTKCMGITDCACAGGDAGSCPGTTQVCTGGTPVCKTCGVGGTDNKRCANGKDCDESAGICH